MQIRLKKKIFVMLTAGSLLFPGAISAAVHKDSGEVATGHRKPLVALKKNFSLSPRPTEDGITTSPISGSLIPKFLSGLQTGGYYRGYFISRKLTDPYGGIGANKVMSVGDGYLDPMLFLYVGGQPTPTTSFGTEVMILNPFLVYHGPGSTTVPTVGPYFTAVLRGGFNTDVANVNIVLGGIEWLRLTPFTFGANTGYNRYSIFERRPWDPVGNIKTRYASYYYNGSINQDTRWGTQAFKGITINSFFKKLNANLDVFYGKAAPNGGIERENIQMPSQNLGVRFKKNLKNSNYVSLNTFNSFRKSDSINTDNDIQWNIFTSEFSYNFKGIILNGEVGAGRYVSPVYSEDWSEGIILDLMLPKKLTVLPFSLRFFQIGNSFTSNVANFNNTTIQEVTGGGINGTGTPVQAPFGGSVENVGDLANNRRGGAINTDLKVWKFVFTVGAQVSSELELLPQSTTIAVGHRINGLVWSRLPGVFPLNGAFGPAGRTRTFYRGAYEVIGQTDTGPGGVAQYKRHYNSLDAQMKFKERVFDRDVYVYYLGSFNSAQREFSPITKFNDDAYLRAQYHEAELYYQLFPKFILAFYTGLEKIKGNQFTDLGPNGKPIDQTGQALGVGFDFAISTQTTLFFRQRWFSFDDKNFPDEKFNGNEATIELKTYF